MIIVSNTTPLIALASINKIGTVGILLKAKEAGFVLRVGPQLKRLQQKGFNLSQNIFDAILRQANEE